jgi:endonuclease/exonuclease/phosphatase family metal-dependent hydrolase
MPAMRAPNGGILVDPAQPNRWLPGFRITRYAHAPCVNVGARLLSDVVGPLNYRVESFQIVARDPIEVEHVPEVRSRTRLEAGPEHVRILTLNGFNLDARVEDPTRVQDRHRDVDDDVLYGRFEGLARAIVEQAGSPEIIALQEIQDNDGAELSDVVDASATYEQLQRDVLRLGGPAYDWADIPPEPGADGGQPGGNIRNAFLYNPAYVELLRPQLRRIGADAEAFHDSRKALLAHFRVRATGAELVVVNVHLASKRHQRSIFAAEDPGDDPREATRVRQAEIVRDALADARAAGLDFYITGDFNDFEFSPTLRALCADDCVNLVETLPPDARYDYNHRGQLQVLMHGVVPRDLAAGARYEILHGNELNGMKPGMAGGKATDHAYVIASLRLRGPRTPGKKAR